MVFVALIVGYTLIARTGSWDVGRISFFHVVPFGPPVGPIRGCLLYLDIIVGFRPAAPPKQASYPLFEAPRVGRVFTGVDWFCCSLLCVVFGSTPRTFGGGGFMVFEKPEDGDAADNHDEGERYDEHPKANGRSSELRHLELTRCLTLRRLGCQRGLSGDRTRS